ncbi:LPS export ABC transporter periplasmic protein LptC [Cognatilysobacter bugurensis]|uniref:Lipopolysaccharide export system protein LptC n=1 Tax=Cognatilysobacter bugurensis TaxID=543356 RepID=A0A918SY35_9GAMM|nr:LPS export ABC transporter periplasmic protein LptC [Lysobacter bugurensis]GHA77407.1 lipopolysaccharide export system protein LptC [Lysobacter bugurensis]
MSWRGWLTVLLLGAALVTGWSVWHQRADAPVVAVGETRSDYVLEDFELVALDESGRESFTLRAPRLVRDPDQESLDIVTPVFKIPAGPDASTGDWDVRAQRGWVSAGGDELRLRGDVQARSVDVDGRPVSMTTQQLNVFPETKRATSPVETTVRQPGLILNGQRLEAELDAKRVHLEDVKARYERTAR